MKKQMKDLVDGARRTVEEGHLEIMLSLGLGLAVIMVMIIAIGQIG